MSDFDDRVSARAPIAGCGTMALAALAGYPPGLVVARELTGQQGLGGFVGIFVKIFVFGFVGRAARSAAGRGLGLPGPLGDGRFWAAISIGLFVAFFLPWGDTFPGLEWVPVPASAVIGWILHRRRGR